MFVFFLQCRILSKFGIWNSFRISLQLMECSVMRGIAKSDFLHFQSNSDPLQIYDWQSKSNFEMDCQARSNPIKRIAIRIGQSSNTLAHVRYEYPIATLLYAFKTIMVSASQKTNSLVKNQRLIIFSFKADDSRTNVTINKPDFLSQNFIYFWLINTKDQRSFNVKFGIILCLLPCLSVLNQ